MKRETHICAECLSVGAPKLAIGDLFFEFVVNLFLGPGVYVFEKVSYCPVCGKYSMLPLASPAGQEALEKRGSAGLGVQPSKTGGPLNALGHLRRSLRIFKTTSQTLMDNKKLLFFPVAIFVSLAGIMLFVIVGAGCCGAGSFFGCMSSLKSHYGFILCLLPLFYLSVFVCAFLKVAFYSETLRVLDRDQVSITRGLRFACSKIGLLAAWSIFPGFAAPIIRNSALALPAISAERRAATPMFYLRKSASLISGAWGESVVGYVGIRGIFLLLSLVSLVVGAAVIGLLSLAMMTSSLDVAEWFVFLAFATIPAVALLAVFMLACCRAVDRIYLCSLYKYASEGVIPAQFSREDMDYAWKVKK
jgi:hypothetical protein